MANPEMTQAFNVLSKLLKAEAPGVSSGGSQTLSDLNSSMWNTTSDGGLDESEIGTGFTRDPLIDRGIPRQFLKWTPFDWAIPLFAGLVTKGQYIWRTKLHFETNYFSPKNKPGFQAEISSCFPEDRI